MDENINLLPFSGIKETADFISINYGLYVSINLQTLANQYLGTVLRKPQVYGFIDGIGAQFYFKQKLGLSTVKIPGCELWLELLNRKSPYSYSLAIIGATKQVNSLVVKKLKQDFPQHSIDYYVDGFTYEPSVIIEELSQRRINLVFIALGQPKQEKLGLKIIETNPAITVLGIGGALDVYSGVIKRAPRLLVYLKLEWLYRLMLQPRRIPSLLLSVSRFIKLLVT